MICMQIENASEHFKKYKFKGKYMHTHTYIIPCGYTIVIDSKRFIQHSSNLCRNKVP